MKIVFKILGIFIIVLFLIAAASVTYIVVSYRHRQKVSQTHTPPEEDSWQDENSSRNHLAFFHAVEFLTAQAAENEREGPGILPLPDPVQEMPLRNIDIFFIEQGKGQVEELLNDSGFIAWLETKNLVLSREYYENVNFVFYDFVTLSGERIGSIGIHKRLGEIYLFDDEYISLGSIRTFEPRSGELSESVPLNLGTLPSGPYERGRIHTVLIVGINQHLTDTLILAIANEDTQTIDLVSLPRDLYYHDYKINEFYYRYGPRRLIREMESMTGFDIDNFIIIDMYAFIDVINILGGVEITLLAPLVDPAYRVRDNGQWSTLFYPAGTHHLNGIQALRVARSRHFIMDFGRSRHQQMILTAVINKMTSLGVTDIGKVYELAMVFMRYVETDYTPQDLVRYTIRYRSARVRSQAVFNARDFLYPTYTNLLRMELAEDEVDEDFDLGQYILLPINDDWSLIHRFIRFIMGDPVEMEEAVVVEELDDMEDIDETEEVSEQLQPTP
ncbi:MAG: LCP family protein [Treponema sp.]|nr:LCP family protein [Treponema sp.]